MFWKKKKAELLELKMRKQPEAQPADYTPTIDEILMSLAADSNHTAPSPYDVSSLETECVGADSGSGGDGGGD
jgi:hypothetical protein